MRWVKGRGAVPCENGYRTVDRRLRSDTDSETEVHDGTNLPGRVSWIGANDYYRNADIAGFESEK